MTHSNPNFAHSVADTTPCYPAPTSNTPHSSPHQPHSIHIQLLAADIFLSHINDTLKPELGTCGCGSHPMLPGPSFGNNSALAHFLGQKKLTRRIVDLVSSSMTKIFSFEVDPGPAEVFCQTVRKSQFCRPANILFQQISVLLFKPRIPGEDRKSVV